MLFQTIHGWFGGRAGTLGVLAFFAATLSPSVQAEKPTIAVFDFDVGASTQVETEVRSSQGRESVSWERSTQSNLLTNRLIHELVQSGEVSVLERDKLDRLMSEVRFNQSELADPSRAVEIGKMLGADYLVFGAITAVDPRVEVTQLPYDAGIEKQVVMEVGANARLVNTKTGVVEASTEQRTKKQKSSSGTSSNSVTLSRGFQQDAYSQLAGKMAADLMNALNPVTVARQSGDQVYLARGNMKAGTRCRVVNQGEAIKDPETGEVLGRMEEPVAIIEVNKGLKKMSMAKVIEWKADQKTIQAGARCRPIQE